MSPAWMSFFTMLRDSSGLMTRSWVSTQMSSQVRQPEQM